MCSTWCWSCRRRSRVLKRCCTTAGAHRKQCLIFGPSSCHNFLKPAKTRYGPWKFRFSTCTAVVQLHRRICLASCKHDQVYNQPFAGSRLQFTVKTFEVLPRRFNWGGVFSELNKKYFMHDGQGIRDNITRTPQWWHIHNLVYSRRVKTTLSVQAMFRSWVMRPVVTSHWLYKALKIWYVCFELTVVCAGIMTDKNRWYTAAAAAYDRWPYKSIYWNTIWVAKKW